jgi:WD40 repeat protein
VESPGWRGNGIDGRLVYLVSNMDPAGPLQFSAAPAEAPIIHFGGPWAITFYSQSPLAIGRDSDLVLSIGTPGLGAGTAAFVAYEDLVPERLMPVVEVTYPPKNPGEPGITQRYELKERCCTINLHGAIRVPDSVGVGKARAKVSFDAWAFGGVAPTEHTLKVAAPPPGPKLEAVSARLKRSLQHPTWNPETLCGVRFSPDCTQIIAGDYPGGLVQLWDVATGKQLSNFQATHPRGYDYFWVSPDWKTIFASVDERKYSWLERDGQKVVQWKMYGGVRSWELLTGQEKHFYQHNPPRSVAAMQLSPDGRKFVTQEELPGEDTNSGPQRAASLWDVKSKSSQPLPSGFSPAPNCFSADNRYLLGSRTLIDAKSGVIELIDAGSLNIVRSVAVDDKRSLLTPYGLSPDSRLLLASRRTLAGKNDEPDWHEEFVLWDLESGKEALSLPAPGRKVNFTNAVFLPDGKTLVATTGSGAGYALLLDVPQLHVVKTFELGPRAFVQGVFSPDGRWLALISQVFPEATRRSEDLDQLPQTRVHLVDMATREIRETIILPQGFVFSACFSPDGKTLATGGRGKVHLWDVSDLK